MRLDHFDYMVVDWVMTMGSTWMMRQAYTCPFDIPEVWNITDVMEVASWTWIWHIESWFDGGSSSLV